MTDWRVSYSNYDSKPAELDTTSSPTTVYERKDFEEVELPSMIEGEDPIKQWKYMERTYTQSEYAIISMTTEKVAASVELKHESEIIDAYTNSLLEEGLI